MSYEDWQIEFGDFFWMLGVWADTAAAFGGLK
jgi:hypothetical protein